MENYLDIMTQIMQKAPLQSVLDAAAEFLDAAIVFLDDEMHILATSTVIPPRDPNWQKALRTTQLDDTFLSKVYSSTYVKTMSRDILSGISFPPDNVTVKYWIQYPSDDRHPSVTVVALPQKDEFPAKKQTILRSFAWLVKRTYLDDGLTPLSFIHSAERDILRYALDRTNDTLFPPAMQKNAQLFSDKQLVVFRPMFQQMTVLLWGLLVKEMDRILQNQITTLYDGCVVSLTGGLSGPQRDELLILAKQSNAYVGVSWRFSGWENVRRHYRQALYAADTLRTLNREERVGDYDQYYLCAIIDSCRKNATWAKHTHPVLARLREYDAEHKAEMYATLECYLRSGMYIAAAAEMLGVHKSTLQHRREILDELLCDVDLTRPEVQTALLTAFDIEQMRALQNWQ